MNAWLSSNEWLCRKILFQTLRGSPGIARADTILREGNYALESGVKVAPDISHATAKSSRLHENDLDEPIS